MGGCEVPDGVVMSTRYFSGFIRLQIIPHGGRCWSLTTVKTVGLIACVEHSAREVVLVSDGGGLLMWYCVISFVCKAFRTWDCVRS